MTRLLCAGHPVSAWAMLFLIVLFSNVTRLQAQTSEAKEFSVKITPLTYSTEIYYCPLEFVQPNDGARHVNVNDVMEAWECTRGAKTALEKKPNYVRPLAGGARIVQILPYTKMDSTMGYFILAESSTAEMRDEEFRSLVREFNAFRKEVETAIKLTLDRAISREDLGALRDDLIRMIRDSVTTKVHTELESQKNSKDSDQGSSRMRRFER